MNQKAAFILTALFFTLLLSAQTITIEYTSQNTSNPRTLDGLPDAIKKYSFAKRYFTLLINNNESLYYKTPGQAPIIDIPIKQKGQYITYSDEHYYYKNQTENVMLFELPNEYNTTKGKDRLPVYDWDTRSEETKRIKGYSCKRATLWKDNILYIAYYTTELPAGNGPDRFGGLPGTILMLKFKKMVYTARSIKISKENTVIDRPVFTGKTLTYAEYLAKSTARNEAEKAKYPTEDYGPVKLIMKTEADVHSEEEIIKD